MKKSIEMFQNFSYNFSSIQMPTLEAKFLNKIKRVGI